MLFAGNSLAIRQLDQFAAFNENLTSLFANRGASGIDGNIATAAGLIRGKNRPLTALIGDLTCLYDLNALSLLRDLPQPMTIVVLNNQGGGIFSFLPIANANPHFEKYFATPHGLDFKRVAELFDVRYAQPETPDGFRQCYMEALKSGKSSLIEVCTRREDNVVLMNSMEQFIKKSVNK